MISKQVRCPLCGKLLCRIRLDLGSTAIIETVCTRCRKPVSIEVQERPAA